MTGSPSHPTPGRTLILIRHATPIMDFDRPAADWELSPQGITESRALARELADSGLARIYASREPKASGTAREIADVLGIGWEIRPGLHEHQRDALPEFGRDAWHALIRRCLNEPDNLVFGLETANMALKRFTVAVDALLRQSPAGVIGIASHGTVMSLYIAARTGKPAFVVWAGLRMPDYVVLEPS